VGQKGVENFFKLFAAALKTPGAILLAGVDALVRAMSEMQTILDSGLDNLGTGKHMDSPAIALQDDGPVHRTNSKLLVQTTPKEKIEMADQDLRGDDLKLVRWAISFTKRDVELALSGGIELVDYSADVGDFKGSKKDDFLRQLRLNHMPLPDKWRNENYPPAKYISGDQVTDLPPSDSDKYLRVFVEVLDRYERADADYEKEGSKALRGIDKTLGGIEKTLDNWPH
jgi:hypothetical protein